LVCLSEPQSLVELIIRKAGKILLPGVEHLAPRRTGPRGRYVPTVDMGYCCHALREHAEHACPDHPDPTNCPDLVILRTSRGEFGLPIHDGGSSFIKIRHCPWCGKRLTAP